jgi:hypothetical protein
MTPPISAAVPSAPAPAPLDLGQRAHRQEHQRIGDQEATDEGAELVGLDIFEDPGAERHADGADDHENRHLQVVELAAQLPQAVERDDRAAGDDQRHRLVRVEHVEPDRDRHDRVAEAGGAGGEGGEKGAEQDDEQLR